MKKTITPLVLAALAALTTSHALAQRGGPPRGPQPGPEGPGFADLDADGDGVISREEWDAARAGREARRQAILEAFDENSDGVLDEAERSAAREAREAEHEAARTERFGEIDANGDGSVSLEELTASMPDADPERVARILEHLDADESGEVSLDEFLNPPARGEARPRGPQRRGPVDRRGGGPRRGPGGPGGPRGPQD